MAGLVVGTALLLAACGGSNETAMTDALAKIDLESTADVPSTSTTASSTTSAPISTTSSTPSTTTAPPVTTSSTEATTPPTTAASAGADTEGAVPGVDHPDWDLVCATNYVGDEQLTRCAPYGRNRRVVMVVPAVDELGCGAWLDGRETYDPDLGSAIRPILMAPIGDGSGVHVDTWYPDYADPADEIAIVRFTPADLRPSAPTIGDTFPDGHYVCFTSHDSDTKAVFFTVRSGIDLEDWAPEGLITVNISYYD